MNGRVGGWRPRIAVALLLAACGGGSSGGSSGGGEAIAAPLAQRIEVDGREVTLGMAFPLRVVRTFRSDLEPEPFDGERLSPLVVALLSEQRRATGGRIEEVLHFRARAFTAGDLVVPEIAVRAVPKGGGAPVAAASAPLELTVRSALGPDADAAPEMAELLVPPGPARWWLVPSLLLGLVAVAAGTAWMRRRRRVAAAVVDAASAALVGPSAAEVALAQLEALPGRALDDGAFAGALSATLRDWAGAAFGSHAATRTTDELLADATRGGAPEPARAPLARCLGACDLVKFARAAAPAKQRAVWLADARAAVQAAVPGLAEGRP